MISLIVDNSDNTSAPNSKAAHIFSFSLALLFLTLALFASFLSLDYNWNWSQVFEYRSKFIIGWLTTIGISLISLICSVGIGLVSALLARSRILPLRYLSKIYVEIIRGTPLLVQIFIFFYVIADTVGIENRYVMGVVIMSLFSGAYISEIVRAGMESVGKSQRDSAKAVGFTAYQTFRYVIFPQALRQSLPALAGQFANLIKDSSLLSVIAISEFTLNAQEVNAITYSTFESFFPLAIGYLALSLPIMRLSRYIEKRLAFDT